MESVIASFMGVAVVALIVAAVYAAVRIWLRVDTVMHDAYCTCERCRAKEIQTAVQRREWMQQQEEIESAVAEIFKDLGRRR